MNTDRNTLFWIIGALVVWALLSRGAREQAPPDDPGSFGGFGGGDFGGGGAGGSF